jgi:hypothetical protein
LGDLNVLGDVNVLGDLDVLGELWGLMTFSFGRSLRPEADFLTNIGSSGVWPSYEWLRPKKAKYKGNFEKLNF